GLRYDYYTPMREANDLIVKFNIDTGVIDPNTTRLFESKTNNFQPRVSFTYAPGRTVFRAGAGMFVGPGQTEDQIQPIESDRISSTISNGAFPLDVAAVVAGFTSNPHRRQGQPRACANEYSVPERIYQYTGSVQQELGGRYTASAAYMGSQGHNLFLRSVANRITQVVTNPNPAANAFVIREFSIVQRDAAGNITGVQNPFAEVDYKTSGGHDSYNAMMLQLSRRASTGVSLNVQYTLGKSKGNTAGSNEALTSGNVARALSELDYDNGYNNFDVRHNFKQVDFFFAKHFSSGGRTDVEFRGEVFNLFDTVNFASPVGTLPNALPTAATTEANRVQPGQPYTAAAAGTFGRLTSTVGRTV